MDVQAGWSAPLLFANLEDRFSPVKIHIVFVSVTNVAEIIFLFHEVLNGCKIHLRNALKM